MPLVQLKIVLAALTLVAGWVGAALPLFGRRQGRRGAWIGGGNAFAAGLFLSLGLLHFLPESAASFAARGVRYPLASLLAVAAFLLLLLLEHVLLPEAAHDAAHSHSGLAPHAHPATLDGTRAGPAGSFTLIIALSVHSVLAGLALGADSDRLGTLLTFVAIAVHKATAGLALGLSLNSHVASRGKALRWAGVFSLMTPLGIVLGLTAGGVLGAGRGQLFDAGSAALAGGTFLYIGTFDLLQDEFLKPGRRWAKWILALAGSALASLATILN